MICTYKHCSKKGIDQPIENFKDGKRIYKQCLECRQIQAVYEERMKLGISTKGSNLIFRDKDLVIGEEPQFTESWQREMWLGWLRNLVKEVRNENIRSKNR